MSLYVDNKIYCTDKKKLQKNWNFWITIKNGTKLNKFSY